MQIQILSTSVETKPTAKGSYQQLEIAYKNLTFQGKVESKKLMSFGANAEAFKMLAASQPASVWEIESVKNEKGYLDWTKVTKSSASDASAQASSTKATITGTSATAPTKGGWETPEERAKKQVYIVRQSSIANAISALAVGSKVHPTVKDILDYASQFEAFVFGDSGDVKKIASQDITDLEEDIPF